MGTHYHNSLLRATQVHREISFRLQVVTTDYYEHCFFQSWCPVQVGDERLTVLSIRRRWSRCRKQRETVLGLSEAMDMDRSTTSFSNNDKRKSHPIHPSIHSEWNRHHKGPSLPSQAPSVWFPHISQPKPSRAEPSKAGAK